MSFEEVRRVEYTGDIWASPGSVPHSDLVRLFKGEDRLVVLRHGSPPYPVVLGVPHQAAVGVKHVCERRTQSGRQANQRRSDENAASYALVAFDTLKTAGLACKLVVMAHPRTHDPNKEPESPYCSELFGDEASLLFECHAAREGGEHCLELTAGMNPRSRTLLYGRTLWAALEPRCLLAVQRRSGTGAALILESDGSEREGELRLPALETYSLCAACERGMHALHLEANPVFRIPPDGTDTVTPDGRMLGAAVASAAIDYLSPRQCPYPPWT
jgi:hypothetical protein